jgi:hypothetical protein
MRFAIAPLGCLALATMFIHVLSVPLSQLWLVMAEPSLEASLPTSMLVQPSPTISSAVIMGAMGGGGGFGAGETCASAGHQMASNKAKIFSGFILLPKIGLFVS